MNTLIMLYISVASVAAFIAMGYDKRAAVKKKSRVSEKTLWTLAIAGGGIGAYLGMTAFRHKTRRTNFRVGFFMLFIIYLAALLYLSGFMTAVQKSV